MKSPQRRQSRGVASRRRGPVARTAWCRRTEGSAERLSQMRKNGKQITPVMPVMPITVANQPAGEALAVAGLERHREAQQDDRDADQRPRPQPGQAGVPHRRSSLGAIAPGYPTRTRHPGL